MSYNWYANKAVATTSGDLLSFYFEQPHAL